MKGIYRFLNKRNIINFFLIAVICVLIFIIYKLIIYKEVEEYKKEYDYIIVFNVDKSSSANFYSLPWEYKYSRCSYVMQNNKFYYNVIPDANIFKYNKNIYNVKQLDNDLLVYYNGYTIKDGYQITKNDKRVFDKMINIFINEIIKGGYYSFYDLNFIVTKNNYYLVDDDVDDTILTIYRYNESLNSLIKFLVINTDNECGGELGKHDSRTLSYFYEK